MVKSNHHSFYRVTCKWTIFHSLCKSLLNRSYKLSWNNTTHYFILELKALFIIFSWPDFEYDIGKFTSTTSLLLVNLPVFEFLSKCFFICYLRSSLVYFNLKLSLHTVYYNFKMKLSHTS